MKRLKSDSLLSLGSRKNSGRLPNRLCTRSRPMASRLGMNFSKPFTTNQMVLPFYKTIGRGMQNGCPVAVYFVNCSLGHAIYKRDKPDSGQGIMLSSDGDILKECVSHPDPVIEVSELYTVPSLHLRIEEWIYPNYLSLKQSWQLQKDFWWFFPHCWNNNDEQ